jgi:AP-2 complex subunit sigma-1
VDCCITATTPSATADCSLLLLPSRILSGIPKPSSADKLVMVRNGRIKQEERSNDVYSNSWHVTAIDTHLIRSLSLL